MYNLLKNFDHRNKKPKLDSYFLARLDIYLAEQLADFAASAQIKPAELMKVPEILELVLWNKNLIEGKYYASDLFEGRYDRWNPLVPIIPAALKEYHEVSYSSWVKDDCFKYFFPLKYLYDEYWKINLEDRPWIVSQVKNVTNFPRVYYKGLDAYTVAVGFQLWWANAALRNEHMVLDFEKLDRIPPALDLV